MGKSHNLLFSSSQTQYLDPLQLVQTDIWGPSPMFSFNGFKYYISFVDMFTRYTWVYLIKSKSEVLQIFKNTVELQFGHKLKILQIDCGKEFIALTLFLESWGIKIRHSCPCTHQQNGVVERKHRHLVDTALSMLSYASMPLKFWDESILSAYHLINILPTPVLQGKPPHEVLFKVKPSYSNLRVFGCSYYQHMRAYNCHKFEFRSTLSTFIGYSTKFKGYKCLTNTGKVIYTRHVLFDELSFPFQNKILSQNSTSQHVDSDLLPSIAILPKHKLVSVSIPTTVHPVITPLHSISGSGSGSCSSNISSPLISDSVPSDHLISRTSMPVPSIYLYKITFHL